MQRNLKRQLHKPEGSRRPYGTFSVYVEGEYITVKQWRQGSVYKARTKVRDGDVEAAALIGRMKLDEKLRRLDEGLSTLAPTMKVTDFVAQWIDTQESMGKRAPATIENLRARNRGHIAKTSLGRMRIGDVTVTDVERWLLEMAGTYSKGTMAKDKACLSMAMKDAKKRGLIAVNPVLEADMPRSKVPDRELEALTTAEFNTLLKAVEGSQLEAAVALGLLAALRPGEALALSWNNINFVSGLIHVRASQRVSKGGTKVSGPTKNQQSNADVPMSAELATILQRTRKRQQETRLRHGIGWSEELKVAGDDVGEPRHNSAVGNALRDASEKAIGRRVSPQELRRTATTRLAALGTSEADVLKFKRSTDVKTLRKSYDKRTGEDMREVAASLGKLQIKNA
jgi:integrase